MLFAQMTSTFRLSRAELSHTRYIFARHIDALVAAKWLYLVDLVRRGEDIINIMQLAISDLNL